MKALIFLLLLSTSVGNTTPLSNILIPAQPNYIGDLKLEVEFETYCLYAPDYSTHVILTMDDSGDMTVSSGVVYSKQKRNCHGNGRLHKHKKIVNLKSYGYDWDSFLEILAEEGNNLFKPMDITSD